MKPSIPSLFALALSVAALSLSLLPRGSKIGYAETGALMAEFSEAIKAKKLFEEAQKEWDRNLATLDDSLMAAMDRMKAGYESASPAEKERMRATLKRRNEDLQRYSNAVKRMSEEKERELMEPVVKKLNSYLDLWGRKNGYDMLFGTTSGGNILQADPGLDVTARVLSDMNAHYRDLPEATRETNKAPGGKPSFMHDSAQ